jgi:hypothetical protein
VIVMATNANCRWNRLRRSLAANLGRFAGGTAVTDLLGLLAVEQERLATRRRAAGDASPPGTATLGAGSDA